MDKQQYENLIVELTKFRLELKQNLHINYLLPNEIEQLKKIQFLPQQSATFFSRAQAIKVLDKLLLGIKLEQKVYYQSPALDK